MYPSMDKRVEFFINSIFLRLKKPFAAIASKLSLFCLYL